ncbi:Peptidase A1 [Macleaya cordata]|uniref:Peptidase A1 n=1 Tax=Macleaya cordata TaxID=56857 RepID=A0A200QX90_MACCD|nr:Peptidase A1 [Macleaya cordata]
MAETGTDHAVVFLFLLSITLFLLLNSVIAGPNGLTMKLIHRDSLESPLYPGNLTQQERIRRLVEQSKARIRYLTATKMAAAGYNNQTDPIGTNGASLPNVFEGQFYMALVGIGSFYDGSRGNTPYYNYYYLIVDTASELIWTQCEGCSSCFRQSKPYFPYKKSTSYHPLPCNHPLCEPEKCLFGLACIYDKTYSGGLTSKGILATEKFTVGLTEIFRDVVFGCGLNQTNFPHEGADNKIAGVLGIGRGPKSFLTQLGHRGGGRFSYCLQNATEDIVSHTYLSFGEDAKIGGPEVQTIALYGTSPGDYYLNLQDISVSDRRILFPEFTFSVKTQRGQERGGCIIDTGTQWTTFYRPIYETVKDYVARYFVEISEPMGLMGDNDFGFDLCYQRQMGFDKFPSIMFHFAEADFVVDPHAAFYITDTVFCLAFLPIENEVFDAVIGSWQTTNHRILFDVKNSKLSFAKEDCVSGS